MKTIINLLIAIAYCSTSYAQIVSLEAKAWISPEICEDCTTCKDTISNISTSHKKIAFYCDGLLVSRWQLSKHNLIACDSTYYSYARGDQSATYPNLGLLLQNIFSHVKTGCHSQPVYGLELLGETKDEVSKYFLGNFSTRSLSIVNPERKIISDQKIYDTDQLDAQPCIATCSILTDEEERRKCSEKETGTVLSRYVRYPPEARMNGISGIAIVDLIIDESGDIVDVELTKDLAGGCGKATLDAAYSIIGRGLKFTPGYINGEAVITRFALPMQFTLR